MRSRFIFPFLVTVMLLSSLQWMNAGTRYSMHSGTETSSSSGKHKKKKKKKKEKKKKKRRKDHNRKPRTMTAKDSARADKQRQKSLDRIAKDREKKDKQRAKAKAKELNQYDDCDSTKIVRTSKDTAILVKYIRIYRTLGGACYILHLQRMAKLEKTADGFYSVQMKESSDPRAPADWQTYLYCPIGKPNGLVALTSPAGDTVQTCQYQDEKKNGDMIWYKKGKGAIHQEIYTNDVRQMNMLDTLMNH